MGLALLCVAIVAMTLATGAAGGAPRAAAPGLPDAGPLTGWGLPAGKVFVNLCGAFTVGALLVAAVLAPGPGRELSETGRRALMGASRSAAAWAVAALMTACLQASDIVGVPVSGLRDPVLLGNLAGSLPPVRAMAVVAGFAVVICLWASLAASRGAALWLLAAALLAVLPPALTGHSAGAADHDLATSSLLLHVVAAALWLGGLLGLLAYLRRSDALPYAAGLYSSLAGWCFVAVTVSGAAGAATRLGSFEQLLTTSYGGLVLGKVTLLAVLGLLGWRHRRVCLPALLARRPHAFLRLAVVEVAVMAAAVGWAVALGRTAPPPTALPAELSPAQELLGYSVPAFSAGAVLTEWRPDVLVLSFCLAALLLYASGLRTLNARGLRWPAWRAVSFACGVLVVTFVLTSGIATFAMAMFSVHMAQHMALTMLAPILLALGAPVTLALRALPAHRRDEPAGAREWLLAGLHSRAARLLSHPVAALAVYVASLYGLYFTGLFETAMRSHPAHLLMSAHFLAVGILFFWPIIGADPAPRQLAHPARLLLLGVSMPFHAFFGITLLDGNELIARAWYGQLALPGLDLLADQRLGGGIAWAAGEVPTLLVLIAVLPQWFRADERQARREDRRADADGGAALQEYNARLARLARHNAGERA